MPDRQHPGPPRGVKPGRAKGFWLPQGGQVRSYTHPPRPAMSSEEIDDVKKASAEGFGSNEQVCPPSAAFVAKARVKGMDG